MNRKKNSVYVCQNCGASHVRWEGRCTACSEWNTLHEEILEKKSKFQFSSSASAVPLTQTARRPFERTSTGIGELDRVLGGGLVSGSYILLGGPPGIGKSTLLLQMSGGLSRRGKVLYACSEESTEQTALRARRLNISSSDILLFNESSLENILEKARTLKPAFVIVDSIQSVYLSELQSAPGTVSQVRECSSQLQHFAKASGASVLIIGHVTKDGSLAGPRVLEHAVDAVLSFEGETHYRVLKALKNRFGAVSEFGVFQMSDEGLKEIQNPSEFFLEERGEDRIGSAVFTGAAGGRPLLCEIQALTLKSYLTLPRRTSLGIDVSRLHLILAVLEKYFQIPLSKYDVFINLAGGLKLSETAVDLAVISALLSSYHQKPLRPCFFGETGLTGEIRSCPYGKERVQEAKRLGFQEVVLPQSNKKHLKISGIKIKGISHITELSSLFS